ncbi:indole-3-glycerol phosphate synthase TrpC [Geomonas sp. RF6]|uniref:indole-3-glycerol phosphate synthase TrpC n=1 Tax=Geomonas sp. RF6 TaxID=2897342 RepID=UPI001E3A0BDE|nr:indole-3-glycerol phosphate synthase TrpC [Geomonas sp. RF6]UFS69613.1 indole-3-glycerol phosphate synthase TrpC [Geomonas sp. RF6]
MTEIPDILKKIVSRKKEELAGVKSKTPLSEVRARAAEVQDAPRGFIAALESSRNGGRTAIISEVKKGSPSKGIIRADFDPVGIAQLYEANGASCLSVLTEKDFFLGDLAYLRQIRQRVSLPLLRKDFLFDPYQVYEAKVAGADAILLIAAMLELSQLEDLKGYAGELGLDVLLEVHDERELEMALETGCRLIGINNRNLRTFVVDISLSERLARLIPEGHTIVAESGITRREEIVHLQECGIAAFLIGESLMREADIGAKLRELAG